MSGRRRSHRALTALLVALLLPLTGCGGDPQEEYCAAVKEHQKELTGIVTGGGQDALIRALDIFRDLRSKAPSDVSDEWQQVVTRIQALDRALRAAGVDPASYDPSQPPAGLSAEDRGLIRTAAAQLAAVDTQQALATVQQEVLDVCHTPLEL
jgi:hypothetical protein